MSLLLSKLDLVTGDHFVSCVQYDLDASGSFFVPCARSFESHQNKSVPNQAEKRWFSHFQLLVFMAHAHCLDIF